MNDADLNRAIRTTLDDLLASERREQRLRLIKAPPRLIDSEKAIQTGRQITLDRLLAAAWDRERRTIRERG